MFVRRLNSWSEAALLREQWNELADSVPFRTWEWLGNWWRHFGNGREWFVPAIYDASGQLVGIAPWFVRQFPAWGRVIHFLGSGEVCSDYASVLCRADQAAEVAAELAEWLVTTACDNESDTWDILNLDGISHDDPMMNRLLDELQQRGCTVHRQNNVNAWRIPLPATWDEYKRKLAKPNRRRVRMVQERFVETGLAQTHRVESRDEFERAWNLFTDLHQRRRQSLGQPGCFANPAFSAFLHEACLEFLDSGWLELSWIEKSGTPMAAQLAFLGERITYAYQVGIEPEMLADSPGWLIHSESIKRAIRQGNTTFDFLRGDEPYKAHMGAQPHGMMSVRVVPPRIGHKLLNSALVTGSAVKTWIKTHLHITGIW